MAKKIIEKPESKFLKVGCKNCGNQQVIFDKSATVVKCLVCDTQLTKPTGGKALILGNLVTGSEQ